MPALSSIRALGAPPPDVTGPVGSGRAIAARSEMSHAHDAISYMLNPRCERLIEGFRSYRYMAGSQWSDAQRAQSQLNHSRSLILGKLNCVPKVKFDSKRFGVVKIG